MGKVVKRQLKTGEVRPKLGAHFPLLSRGPKPYHLTKKGKSTDRPTISAKTTGGREGEKIVAKGGKITKYIMHKNKTLKKGLRGDVHDLKEIFHPYSVGIGRRRRLRHKIWRKKKGLTTEVKRLEYERKPP